MVIVRIARGISDHFPARASEWALAGMLFNLGVVFGQPERTFERVPSLAGLAVLFSEQTWAWGLLVVGAVRIIALGINGTFAHTAYGRLSPHVRAALAFVSCFFWLSITIGLNISAVLSPGLGIYPVLLLLDMYNTVRATKDAAVADRAWTDARTRP